MAELSNILKPSSSGSKNYHTSVAIEFRALFDIPFGIIREILYEFNDPNVFDQIWMRYDNYTLRSMLYEREHYNPIRSIMLNEDNDSADDLYNQFMENPEYYNKILQLSPITAIYPIIKNIVAIKNSDNGDMVDYIIICNNPVEDKFIKQSLGTNINVTTRGFKTDLQIYNMIILERYENLLEYKNSQTLQEKVIWVPDFAYNMSKTRDHKIVPKVEVSTFVGIGNNICTYEPYINYIKPVG